jgi:hypothetical protein
MSIMSGLPLYFTANGTSLNAPNNTQTPNLLAPVHILHGVGATNPWFSVASFAAPVGAKLGSVGRNYLSGPSFFNLDAGLSKSIRLTERYSLDLRLEAFGRSNTPQFFFASNAGAGQPWAAAASATSLVPPAAARSNSA